MIVLDLSGQDIARIKAAAESHPITADQLRDQALSGDASFPSHLTIIVPDGWQVGYVVEEQPQPYGLWRRLRVTRGQDIPPPQEGVIKLMEAFGFECAPEDCLWVPEQVDEDIATICVMEPLGGVDAMQAFQTRMVLAEQISEAQQQSADED